MTRRFVLWAVMLCAAPAPACSIFMAVQGDTVLAGNNEDYYFDAVPVLWASPAADGGHGRVTWGFEGKTPFAQGGINDAGLFFDAAVTPEGPTARARGKARAPRNLGDAMLASCATAAEAVAWLDRFDLRLLKGGHLLIADATGDAVVVEQEAGAMKTFRRKTKSYVAATNFAFAGPARGNYPCPRFAKIDAHFGGGGAVTPEAFRALLSAVAQPRTPVPGQPRDGGTLYSTLCDLKQRSIVLYLEGRFETGLHLDAGTLIAQGPSTRTMASLFAGAPPQP